MNSEKFLSTFYQIETKLKQIINANSHHSFSQLVKQVSEKNAIVRRYKEDLLQFGDLRNAVFSKLSKPN